MPKDRSFAHRIHQSNIDRQRNQAYFANGRLNFTTPPESKAGAWEILKTFVKGLWVSFKGLFQ